MVLVKSKDNKWLKPIPFRLAKEYLETRKAKVIKKEPFTIKLWFQTTEKPVSDEEMDIIISKLEKKIERSKKQKIKRDAYREATMVNVISIDGRQLLPMPKFRAEKKLEKGYAKVINEEPFTIQLVYEESNDFSPVVD